MQLAAAPTTGSLSELHDTQGVVREQLDPDRAVIGLGDLQML